MTSPPDPPDPRGRAPARVPPWLTGPWRARARS